MRRKRCRHSGLALILVLILVASATVLGVSYVSRTTVKLICSDNLMSVERSRYLAESGIHHGMYMLVNHPSDILNVQKGGFTIDDSGDTYGFTAAAVDGESDQYVVYGTGNDAGISQDASVRLKVQSRYRDLVHSLGAAHYWRLGEPSGSLAYDTRGSENGYYQNGVSQNWDGAILFDTNRSAHFDGSNDYVDLDPVNLYGHMTIVAWVYADRHNHLSGHDARIISKATGTDRSDHYWMLSTTKSGTDTRLRFRLRTVVDSAESVTELVASSGDVPTQKWVFVAVTYDGSKMRIYQNARKVGECSKTGSIATSDFVNAWIGGNPSGDRDRPWKGRIDEVATFTYALSQEQLSSLCNARIPEKRVLAWDEDQAR